MSSLPFIVDIDEILRLHKLVREYVGKENELQIAITCRDRSIDPLEQLISTSGGLGGNFKADTWEDGLRLESECKDLCSWYDGTYIEDLYNELSKHFILGRTRFMLMKSKYCYTMHRDATPRFHIPVLTDKDAVMFDNEYTPHKLNINRLYTIDTTRQHTAANFSRQERLHIVGGFRNHG